MNDASLSEAIRHERAVALRLLDPSPRDLERGLELHRQLFVAESYSLGLHAPVDPDELNRLAAAGAIGEDFRDLLEEQLMLNWVRTPELRAEYARAWEAAGVSCLFLNAGEEGNDPLRLLRRLARYTFLMDAMPDVLARATTVEGILDAHRQGKRSLCLTLNGVPLAGRHGSVEDELRYIRVFAQLGVGMMHLTYNRRNAIGDGCAEPRDGGLSHFGHEVVAELNRVGVIIDLAHTGWQTTLDVCRATRQPVVISHSTVHALNQHIRAKPDEVIRAVLDTGGTMGITNYPTFLGGQGNLLTMLDHIDYMVRTFGADSVTIGTDRAYKLGSADALRQKLTRLPAAWKRWESLWPEDAAVHSPNWRQPEQLQSMAWTNWPLFTVGLVQRGHSEETIRKILGANLLRVAGEVWAARDCGLRAAVPPIGSTCFGETGAGCTPAR